jgi:hypothetical protein
MISPRTRSSPPRTPWPPVPGEHARTTRVHSVVHAHRCPAPLLRGEESGEAPPPERSAATLCVCAHGFRNWQNAPQLQPGARERGGVGVVVGAPERPATAGAILSTGKNLELPPPPLCAGGGGEIMGSQKGGNVGKSQPVLIMIHPVISTRATHRGSSRPGRTTCLPPGAASSPGCHLPLLQHD